MDLIVWLIVGAIGGWLASFFVKVPIGGFIGNIVAGVIGGFVQRSRVNTPCAAKGKRRRRCSAAFFHGTFTLRMSDHSLVASECTTWSL
jgi:uncharacterized membrane protein YeaQ/YmgE (transglycosylase-associated protein family)